MSGKSGDIAAIATALGGAARSGAGWTCRCPAHDDRHASLSLSYGDDGRILWRCHAGCTQEEVLDALNSLGLLSAGRQARRIAATYDYRDETGKLISQVVRLEPKTFRQRRPAKDGDDPARIRDGWCWTVKGTRIIPYHLPEVVEAIGLERPVFIVEGEKDADRLTALGLTATCNAGGAGKWRKEHAAALAGASAIVIPDNDEAGRKHAHEVAASLDGTAQSVRVLDLVGVHEKGDVSDWLAAGHSVEELWVLASEVPPWVAPPKPNGGSHYHGPVLSIGQLVRVFRRWLRMGRDGDIPLLAMLGAVAANRLHGRPVWLALVGPPSTSKTELLDTIAHLPDVHEASSLTPAGLLSATPKKSRDGDAKGGLLNQIGAFGILTFKDFTSVLSMRRETMAEILAALREVYDGKWKRSTGTDGGREYRWKGKIGAIIGVTEAIDSHHSVMAQMGERFVLIRIADSTEAQLLTALDHTGERENAMKAELMNAVSGLFAAAPREPQPMAGREKRRLSALTWLAVHLRAPVQRDSQNREITQVYRVEGPSRLGLTLERLLAGLCSIGVRRRRAFQIIEKVALDSVPPVRLKVYRLLSARRGRMATTDVGTAVRLPTTTVRRALEELEAHGLVARSTEGKAHEWELAETVRHLSRNVPYAQAEMKLDDALPPTSESKDSLFHL